MADATTAATAATAAVSDDLESSDVQWASYIASLRSFLRKDSEITSTLEKFIRLTMTGEKRPSVHSYLPVDGPPLDTFLRCARDTIVRHMHGRRHSERPSSGPSSTAFAFADDADRAPSALDCARSGVWTLADTIQWIASKDLREALRKALQRCRANFQRRERQRQQRQEQQAAAAAVVVVDPVPPSVLATLALRDLASTAAAAVVADADTAPPPIRVKAEPAVVIGFPATATTSAADVDDADVEPPLAKKALSSSD